MTDQTLCIIKPDGFIKSHLIINELCVLGFKVIKERVLELFEEEADEFYKENRGKAPHENNIKHMSSGKIRVMVLEAENAVADLRRIIGATDPQKAEKHTLRARYGSELPKNAVHGSDSVESAKREIRFFFDEKTE